MAELGSPIRILGVLSSSKKSKRFYTELTEVKRKKLWSWTFPPSVVAQASMPPGLSCYIFLFSLPSLPESAACVLFCCCPGAVHCVAKVYIIMQASKALHPNSRMLVGVFTFTCMETLPNSSQRRWRTSRPPRSTASCAT